jgi:hypothetical protein
MYNVEVETQKMVQKRLFMKQLRLQHRYPLTFSFHPTSESINPPPVVPAASAEPMRLVTKSASVRGVANFMIRYALCLCEYVVKNCGELSKK